MLLVPGSATGFWPIWMKVRNGMMINGNNPHQHMNAISSKPPVHADETDPATADSAPRGIEISSTRVLNRLVQAAGALPGGRTKKVESLRKQIKEDRYHIGSDKLARKVVYDVLVDALVNEGRDE